MLLIPLTGPAAEAKAEISGLAWYGDQLVLLPQYPGLFGGDGESALFTLSKMEIIAFLERETDEALMPRQVPLITQGIANRLPGFEGFEAIAFDGERAFLTVESSPGGMMGHVVLGAVTPGLASIELDVMTVDIPPQTEITNLSDEAVLVTGEGIFTFYEANGMLVNPQPQAHHFDYSLNLLPAIAFPGLEYRLTDVTALDADGRFWALNFFFPGDEALAVETDALTAAFGEGTTHAQYGGVERLVLMQYDGGFTIHPGEPPILLELLPVGISRNWEGLVRMEDDGFLLVTDKYPATMLAFVPRTMEGCRYRLD